MPRAVTAGLTDKQKVFVDKYLQCWNASEAARASGYKSPQESGWQNLQNPEIQKMIQGRLAEFHMTADEALKRMADIARGDIGNFLTISNDGHSIDLLKAQKQNQTNLIKRVKQKTVKTTYSKNRDVETHTQEIELYPADIALERILKVHGKLKENEPPVIKSNAKFFLPAHVIAPAFLDVNRDIDKKQHTEYVFRGGRGSTKSSFISEKIINLLKNNPTMHALATRQVANTLRDSVYAQLTWAINELGFSDEFKCTTSPLEIEYLPTGQKIYFRGADDPGKIKSIKPAFGYIGILWFEELDQYYGPEAIRKIEQSVIRGGDDGYIFKSFNPPPTSGNWANKYLQIPKDTQYQHFSNYLGLPKEYLDEYLKAKKDKTIELTPLETMIGLCTRAAVPVEWLGKVWLDEAEHLRNTNLKAFENEYLGLPTNDGGMVFTNVVIRRITDEEIENFDRVLHGLDWGFYPDPASYGKMHYDSARRKLYIFGEAREWKKSNEDLHKVLIDSKLYTNADLLIADSAEPKSVGDFKAYGANCRGAEKGPESVKYSIKWLQGLTEIVIDNVRAPYHAEEFLGYEFERTKDGEIISEYPDKNNHAIDDTRYATNLIWRRKGE